jgi:regulator of sirC expression with transglutaminase-like and TPR domain
LRYRFILPILVTFFGGCSRQGGAPFDVLDRVSPSDTLTFQTALTIRRARGVMGNAQVPPLQPFLDAMEKAARSREASGFEEAPPESVIQELRDIVYQDWNITFDSAADDIRNLLPHTVFERKRGGCLGVSLIFLILAEKLRVPLYGVLLPGHFFLRYDNGITRINLEPNRNGMAHPDSYYVQNYPIDGNSFYALGNLTRQHTIVVLNYAVGTYFFQRGQCTAAIQFLQDAADGWPLYAEAYGNLGLAYDCLGLTEKALSALGEAAELRPEDRKARMDLQTIRLKSDGK